MKRLIPQSSTILFFILLLFLASIFISYKLLLKNIHDNHIKNQELTFNSIQRQTSQLLTKLLYKYSEQKNILMNKHKEVINYLEANSYDLPLDEIHKLLNKENSSNLYNIYITDENLIIKNTTFLADLNFDLSFAKELLQEHKRRGIIGISPPVFEMYSLKFFSYSDSFLPKNDKRVLQVSYTYDELNEDLQNLQNLINATSNIKTSNAYIIFSDGYVGDFIFKSLKSHKPTLEDINNRIKKGKELANTLSTNNIISYYIQEDKQNYKSLYFLEQSPIFNEAKIIYSIVFDEKEYENDILNLNIAIVLISIIGLITIFLIYIIRHNEKLLKYKDKFIEHSVHEIKTPLSIINLNSQLRNKTFGKDKYSEKIEGALRTLENSYEDMTFLHTRNQISYIIEKLNLNEVLEDRVKYFELVALSQNRKLELLIHKNIFVEMSKIELNRLIDNNLSNAIKYSQIGTTVRIILRNNSLEFHSKGNKIKDIKNIFKKYSRENDSVGGHGLGLSIVKDICQKYNIDINVTSLENETNIFAYKFNCHTLDTSKI